MPPKVGQLVCQRGHIWNESQLKPFDELTDTGDWDIDHEVAYCPTCRSTMDRIVEVDAQGNYYSEPLT